MLIRPAGTEDHAAIRAVVAAAFGQPDKADLVDALRADGDALVELVAAHQKDGLGVTLMEVTYAQAFGLWTTPATSAGSADGFRRRNSSSSWAAAAAAEPVRPA